MQDNRKIPEDLFVYDPIVYVAEKNEYCITFNSLVKGMGWVEIDGVRYINDHNGNIPSDDIVHKSNVPMEILDKAGKYDVVFVPVYQRKPYYPTSGQEQRRSYSFHAPATDGTLRVYQMSDTHSAIKNPVAAASYFGDDLDILIMNGDIPDHSGTIDHIMTLFNLSSQITHGSVPVIFSRGNHDTRGESAVEYQRFTPTSKEGNTYFTFRIGKIWGIILDCGEDKVDNNVEYGGMAAFHQFRLRQTEFIKDVIKRKDEEYEAEGVEYRLVICHVPFDHSWNEHERETYTEWIQLLNEINPDVHLHGHTHTYGYTEPNTEGMFGVVKAPTLTAGDPRSDNFKGLALTIDENGYLAQFTDKTQTVLEEHYVKKAVR